MFNFLLINHHLFCNLFSPENKLDKGNSNKVKNFDGKTFFSKQKTKENDNKNKTRETITILLIHF